MGNSAKIIAVLPAVVLAAVTTCASAQTISVEPFVPISVWYPASEDVNAIRRDFTLIRNAGYNAITTWIAWKDGEPRRGAYNLLGIDRVIAVASETGLKVVVDVYPEPEPSWKTDGTNALAGQFYDYVRRRIGTHPAVIAVDYARSPRDIADHRAIVDGREGSMTPRQARRHLWTAMVSAVGPFGFMDRQQPAGKAVLALGEVAAVITRNSALFAPLRMQPLKTGDLRVDGGPVSVNVLESPDAIVLVAINHSPQVRKARLTFAPGFPEAIWQNMEEGTAVQFVMGIDGPSLEHTFAPEDVLVLAIRKRH
jgi:hypothetical protein